MDQFVTDIRSGIRMLVKYPTLSFVAVVTLGLGIGLSTTVFCVVLHGTGNRSGYDVVFVSFDRSGKAGTPTMFADGFANFDPANPAKRADYRPMGIAQGPDGALYIADSQKGRIWRVGYAASSRSSNAGQKR